MPDPLSYTVAWVCSTPTELAAAQAFLDERHKIPSHFTSSGRYSYSLGRISGHNVVLACVLQGQVFFVDQSPGAEADLQNTFPNVRVCLMVGISGGLPSQNHDIRLGDVVVGFSKNGQSGNVQFKTPSSYEPQLSFHTGAPPNVLSTAVAQLMTAYGTAGNPLKNKVDQVLEKSPKLRRRYQRPGPACDRLYQSHVAHVNDDETCNSCGDDLSHLVVRNSRLEIDAPAIHYGLIGSSNAIIKDASYRDRISAETGILCYRLDTPGWVSHFPCLLIRGISDYCDTHRNQWQGYASIIAAAYAKDLLSQIDPGQLAQETRISDVLLKGNDSTSQVGMQQTLELEGKDETEHGIETESEDVFKSEDEVKITMSYQIGIESTLFEGSRLASQSSQSQHDPILISEFANLLLSDDDLSRLFPKAIPKLGLKWFQRKFTRFLKRYGKDLTNEASNEHQRQAGQFVCQVARRTAAQVGKTLGYGSGTLPVEQLPIWNGPKLTMVDPWLNSHGQIVPMSERAVFGTDSESSESEDENQTSLETLEEVKDFMVSTKAFSTLRQEFSDWLDTGKTTVIGTR